MSLLNLLVSRNACELTLFDRKTSIPPPRRLPYVTLFPLLVYEFSVQFDLVFLSPSNTQEASIFFYFRQTRESTLESNSNETSADSSSQKWQIDLKKELDQVASFFPPPS